MKERINKIKDERKKRGIITAFVGLILNLALGAAKLLAGFITGSVSIMTDAANNLSDTGASVVTVSSFALSSRKADKEHPYGHGRYEYVAGFTIGVAILFIGFQFIITSIKRIITPEQVAVSSLGIVILSVSIAVKLFMAFLYISTSRKLNSDSLKAAAADSLFDVLTTSLVLVSFICSRFTTFNIDGVGGLIVSLVIIWGGVKVITETAGKLLGNGSDSQLSEQIYKLISDPLIIGAHDLCVHDYGPNKIVGSVHAEFDKNISIADAHKIIDRIEASVYASLNVELVIHVDPIDTSNPKLNDLRTSIKRILALYHNTSIHELKLNDEQKEISFDIKLPQKYEQLKDRISFDLKEFIAKDFPLYAVNIGYDMIYNR